MLLLMVLVLAIADMHHSAECYERVVKQSGAMFSTGITQTLYPFLTLLYACPVFSYQGNLCSWYGIAFETCFGIVRNCFSQKTLRKEPYWRRLCMFICALFNCAVIGTDCIAVFIRPSELQPRLG